MRRLLPLALLAAAGCGQFDTGTAARRSLAEHLGCAEAQVEMTQVGAYRYRGEGCGRTATVACTASRLEPECLREGPATAGGRAMPEDDGRGAASAVQPSPDAHRADEEPTAPPPAVAERPDPDVEAQIRAGLDARREDVLACTGAERVAIRAGYAPDGSVALSLQGALADTPEERCVQDALDGVRVAATGGAGVVIHLVR
jgi:hypothetical protein